MTDLPSDAIAIKFGMMTPFWTFSMSYGIFYCPSLNRMFHSLDQYLAFKMLARAEDRSRIMKAPNGYIAYTNLQEILKNALSFADDPAVVPSWADHKDAIMEEGLALKFSQSAILADNLLRTGTRPIFDTSRAEEYHWCYGDGRGNNMHGRLLEKTRDKLRSGELLPFIAHHR